MDQDSNGTRKYSVKLPINASPCCNVWFSLPHSSVSCPLLRSSILTSSPSCYTLHQTYTGYCGQYTNRELKGDITNCKERGLSQLPCKASQFRWIVSVWPPITKGRSHLVSRGAIEGKKEAKSVNYRQTICMTYFQKCFFLYKPLLIYVGHFCSGL